MSDRPILFSGMMVRSIRADQKTQTRRGAKPRRRVSLLAKEEDGSNVWTDSYIMDPGNREWLLKDAPCREGDVCWLRENYRLDVHYDPVKPTLVTPQAAVRYEADGAKRGDGVFGKIRPSMFMRRCWSRETIFCNDIRIERLQAITEADAIAEGITCENVIVDTHCAGGFHHEVTADRYFYPDCPDEGFKTAVDAYRHLWEHLNGPESWAEDQLVWVISFSRFNS